MPEKEKEKKFSAPDQNKLKKGAKRESPFTKEARLNEDFENSIKKQEKEKLDREKAEKAMKNSHQHGSSQSIKVGDYSHKKEEKTEKKNTYPNANEYKQNKENRTYQNSGRLYDEQRRYSTGEGSRNSVPKEKTESHSRNPVPESGASHAESYSRTTSHGAAPQADRYKQEAYEGHMEDRRASNPMQAKFGSDSHASGEQSSPLFSHSQGFTQGGASGRNSVPKGSSSGTLNYQNAGRLYEEQKKYDAGGGKQSEAKPREAPHQTENHTGNSVPESGASHQTGSNARASFQGTTTQADRYKQEAYESHNAERKASNPMQAKFGSDSHASGGTASHGHKAVSSGGLNFQNGGKLYEAQKKYYAQTGQSGNVFQKLETPEGQKITRNYNAQPHKKGYYSPGGMTGMGAKGAAVLSAGMAGGRSSTGRMDMPRASTGDFSSAGTILAGRSGAGLSRGGRQEYPIRYIYVDAKNGHPLIKKAVTTAGKTAYKGMIYAKDAALMQMQSNTGSTGQGVHQSMDMMRLAKKPAWCIGKNAVKGTVRAASLARFHKAMGGQAFKFADLGIGDDKQSKKLTKTLQKKYKNLTPDTKIKLKDIPADFALKAHMGNLQKELKGMGVVTRWNPNQQGAPLIKNLKKTKADIIKKGKELGWSSEKIKEATAKVDKAIAAAKAQKGMHFGKGGSMKRWSIMHKFRRGFTASLKHVEKYGGAAGGGLSISINYMMAPVRGFRAAKQTVRTVKNTIKNAYKFGRWSFRKFKALRKHMQAGNLKNKAMKLRANINKMLGKLRGKTAKKAGKKATTKIGKKGAKKLSKKLIKRKGLIGRLGKKLKGKLLNSKLGSAMRKKMAKVSQSAIGKAVRAVGRAIVRVAQKIASALASLGPWGLLILAIIIIVIVVVLNIGALTSSVGGLALNAIGPDGFSQQEAVDYINKLYDDDMNYIIALQGKKGIGKVDSISYSDVRDPELYTKIKGQTMGMKQKKNSVLRESSNKAEVLSMSYQRFDMDFKNAVLAPYGEKKSEAYKQADKDDSIPSLAGKWIYNKFKDLSGYKRGKDAVKFYMQDLWNKTHITVVRLVPYRVSDGNGGYKTVKKAEVTYVSYYFGSMFQVPDVIANNPDGELVQSKRQIVFVNDSDAYDLDVGGKTYDISDVPNEDLTYVMLRNAGFTHAGACGVMGNIQVQSGFNPLSATSGFGMFALNPDREKTYREKTLNLDKDPTSARMQVEYAIHELHDNPNSLKNMNLLNNAMKHANGSGKAASDWCAVYQGGEYKKGDPYQGTIRAYSGKKYKDLNERIKWALYYSSHYSAYTHDYAKLLNKGKFISKKMVINNVPYINTAKGWLSDGKYTKNNFMDLSKLKGIAKGHTADDMSVSSLSCVASAVSYCTDTHIDPAVFAEYLKEGSDGSLTVIPDNFYQKSASRYGLVSTQVGSMRKLKSEVLKGHPVVALMAHTKYDGKHYWSAVGSYHSVVVTGYNANKKTWAVLDPNNEKISHIPGGKFNKTFSDNVMTQGFLYGTSYTPSPAVTGMETDGTDVAAQAVKKIGAAGSEFGSSAGFVNKAYRYAGMSIKGNSSASSLYNNLKTSDSIPFVDLKAGDVVLLSKDGTTKSLFAEGIYIGDGQMVMVTDKGDDTVRAVDLNSPENRAAFTKAYRLWAYDA